MITSFHKMVAATLCIFWSNAFAQSNNKQPTTAHRTSDTPVSKEYFGIATGLAGFGFGISHEFILRGKFSLGPWVIFKSGSTGGISGSYSGAGDTQNSMTLNSGTSFSSVGFGLQSSFYSEACSGWHLGFLLGANRVVHSLSGSRQITLSNNVLESENFSDSKTTWGVSGGLSLGYLWGFESGLNLGIIAKPVYSTAMLATLNLPQSKNYPSMPKLEINQNEMSHSILGLAIGYAY